MKKLFIACLILVMSSQLFASHIAGGNIEVQYVGINQYQLVMKLYRSCESGSAGMPTSVTVGIYRLDTDVLQASYILTSPAITANLPFGDSCYTPTGLCVDRGIFTSPVITIPDYGPGYYLHSQIYARNASIDNINGPGSTALSFYTEIPDPAIGPNSTPQFGPYPADAYLCLGYTKYFDFGVIDADGDSLSYELVDPLAGATASPTGNGTFAKPHPPITWAGGFGLANICGGAPPMSVDPITGILDASPVLSGKYVFALKVHEWRGGIKIGETTLDIQYEALPCTVDSPPLFTALNDTLLVIVEEQICFEIQAYDNDGTDTIYLTPISSEFDLIGNYVPPTASGGSPSGDFYYLDYLGADTAWIPHFVDIGGGTYEGIGVIPLRYCWNPPCETVDSTFGIDLITYSLGCSGSDTTIKHIEIHVINIVPPILLSIPDTMNVTYGETICFEVFATDTINTSDTLYIEPTSATFPFAASYEAPIASGVPGEYYYLNFMSQDTVWITNYSYGSNNQVGAIRDVPLRYCWTVDCGDVFLEDIDMQFLAYSTKCNSDTSYNGSSIHIDPPVGWVNPIPNVFTPNDDGTNDYFELEGLSDPCYDTMNVEIYNRWGQKVYESTDPEFKWDGTNMHGAECKPGTFFILIKGTYGSTYDPTTGLRIPNAIEDEYHVTLFR
jgi:gliding motility-associated-like protein